MCLNICISLCVCARVCVWLLFQMEEAMPELLPVEQTVRAFGSELYAEGGKSHVGIRLAGNVLLGCDII